MSKSSEMLQVIRLRLDSNDYPERTWVGKQYSKANLIQDLSIVQDLIQAEAEAFLGRIYGQSYSDKPDDLAEILSKGLFRQASWSLIRRFKMDLDWYCLDQTQGLGLKLRRLGLLVSNSRQLSPRNLRLT